MDFIQTIIISIVEGLTEFLPVSSTGHMIIAENLLGVDIRISLSTPLLSSFSLALFFLSSACIGRDSSIQML